MLDPQYSLRPTTQSFKYRRQVQQTRQSNKREKERLASLTVVDTNMQVSIRRALRHGPLSHYELASQLARGDKQRHKAIDSEIFRMLAQGTLGKTVDLISPCLFVATLPGEVSQ